MLNELLRFSANCLGVMMICLATEHYIPTEPYSTIVFIIASLAWYLLITIQHQK